MGEFDELMTKIMVDFEINDPYSLQVDLKLTIFLDFSKKKRINC
jgi:hypothetical protein